jgi:hypothetical protein
MKKSLIAAAFVAVVFLTSFAAHATVMETDVSAHAPQPMVNGQIVPGDETTYDGNIQNNDLLTGATITSSNNNSSSVTPDFGTALTGINDGLASSQGNGANETYFANNLAPNPGGGSLNTDPVVTFTLDTSVNTQGYTLTSINSIYGWQNFVTLVDQDFTVSYQTVGSTGFTLLATVAYNPYATDNDFNGDSSASQVTLTNLTGAVGVDAIQFAFTPFSDATGEQSGQMIREIDVDGTPTVPEPSTWALMGFGGLLLGWRLRRRLSVS